MIDIKIDNNTLVVANITFPRIYNFCKYGNGQKELEEAINNKKENIKRWENNIKKYPQSKELFESYLKEEKEIEFKIIKLSEFEDMEKKYYLDKPIIEISQEEWEEMLNILPPLKWVTINNVNEFLLSEALNKWYRYQYARKNGKYYTKIVDSLDKSTWIHNFI